MFKKLSILFLASFLFLAGCSLDGSTTYTGTYEYAAVAVASGPQTYYSVSVSVKVKDNKIVFVKVNPDTEVRYNLTASWEDKALWIDGQEAFLKSFEGKTVAEVLSIRVSVLEETSGYHLKGQPEEVEGYDVVTGATQSSGRVILAIQQALPKASGSMGQVE